MMVKYFIWDPVSNDFTTRQQTSFFRDLIDLDVVSSSISKCENHMITWYYDTYDNAIGYMEVKDYNIKL